jgi:hypothetical protein
MPRVMIHRVEVVELAIPCRGQDALLQPLREDLPPRALVVRFRQPVATVVVTDLISEEQPGEDRGVRVPAQLYRRLQVPVSKLSNR